MAVISHSGTYSQEDLHLRDSKLKAPIGIRMLFLLVCVHLSQCCVDPYLYEKLPLHTSYKQLAVSLALAVTFHMLDLALSVVVSFNLGHSPEVWLLVLDDSCSTFLRFRELVLDQP